MPQDRDQYFHEQLTSGQNKYTYFLLAAAASAIALAMNRTSTEPLKYEHIPLGLAVACWGMSFLFGCRRLAYVNATLRANAAIFRIEGGSDPEVGQHAQRIEAAAAGVRKAAEHNARKANDNGHRQFRLLVSGAVCYVVWHVIGMALRTPGIGD